MIKLPPVTVLTLALVVGLGVAVLATVLAHERPYLGLKLALPPDASAGVVVAKSGGPARNVPPGTRIVAISGGGDTVELEPLDLITEPDGALGAFSLYGRLIARQDRLARIQAAEKVTLTDGSGGIHVVGPDPAGRPLAALPPDFWVQVFVGLAAWLVSAAVFAFRPRDAGARYLLLSGAATLLFAPAAAVYTTRELAVPGALFRWACDLNFFGGSLFAASFVGLLLCYPRRIAPRWAGPAVIALFVVWFVAQQAGLFESMTFARRALVMAGVASTFVLAGIHWTRTGRDPVARASLQWFLLSWMLGTILFAAFILLPQLFGVDTSPVQGYAFLLFLLVYGGLAFGILRYRLFDLGGWWRKAAGWTAAVLLLVLLDMAFLYGLRLSTGVSLSLALLVCGLVWLPARSWLWERLVERRTRRHKDLFARVLDTALAPPGTDGRDARWRALLHDVFEPLELAEAPAPVESAALGRDGVTLDVPAAGSSPPLRLGFAHSGRRLFTPQDAALASELVEMLRHAVASHAAYEKGVAAERSRIAREMHDHIGSHLHAALRNRDPVRKDETIRATLADLRELINQPAAGPVALDEALAELRVESAERLESAGIHLDWEIHDACRDALPPDAAHALRSVVREAVANAVRHSGARKARIRVDRSDGALSLEIADDGCGLDLSSTSPGNGLANMHARLAALGGTLSFSPHNGGGTRLLARFPHPQPHR